MIQTIEAVINKKGKVQLREPVRLKSNRRALVMILDEEPIIEDEQYGSPPKPKGMGRYHSGRKDVSENAELFLRNRIGEKKCL